MSADDSDETTPFLGSRKMGTGTDDGKKEEEVPGEKQYGATELQASTSSAEEEAKGSKDGKDNG